MKKTIIFDLDGTLLDTLPDLHAAVNHAFFRMNIPAVSRDCVRMNVGNGVAKLIERCLPKDKLSVRSACLKIFGEFYAAHGNDKTAPYEGAERALIRLKAEGLKIAVVSNKTQTVVRMLCDKWFRSLVDVALGDDGIRALKPDPAAIGTALRMLDTPKNDAIYVGDQEVDVLSAKNAGVPLYAAGWGFRGEAALLKAGAERVFSDFDSLTQAILNKNQK